MAQKLSCWGSWEEAGLNREDGLRGVVCRAAETELHVPSAGDQGIQHCC